MEWYVGSLMENDVMNLHHKTTNHEYFKEFMIKMNVNQRFPGMRAQVLDLSNSTNKRAVYFQGSNTWWGVQKKVIKNLQHREYIVYIVLFSNIDDGHYWILKTDEIKDDEPNESNRGLFTESKDKLVFSNISICGTAKKCDTFEELKNYLATCN